MNTRRWQAPVIAACGLLAACADREPWLPPTLDPVAPACQLPTEDPVIVALDAGYDVTMAVTSDGNLWCWGSDIEGWCTAGYLPYPTRFVENFCLTAIAGSGIAGLHPDGTARLWDLEQSIALPDPYTTSLDEI